MLKAVYQNGGYFCKTKNIGPTGSMPLFKFDTGAVNTVVSIEALTAEPVDKENFISAIKDCTVKRTFKSASGNSMEGYLVRAEHVVLSGVKFNEIYYYLIVDVDRPVCLLGDDFISKCTFVHHKDGDIEITAFDSAGYHSEIKCLSKKDVNELLELYAGD